MTRDAFLVGLAASGVVEVAIGSHVHSLLLMAAGFASIAAYCFLYLAWSAE